MKSSALIGTGARNITPNLGCQMAGFDARKGVAEGVHDELYSRALVIDDGASIVALVSIELLGIDRPLATRVRLEVEKRTGIPAQHVVLAATHTHCGPTTFTHFYNQGQTLDRVYLDKLANEIVSSVEDAHSSRKQRRIRSGFVPVEGIAVNRRSEDGKPVDNTAGVLAVEEPDGTLAAVLINFACHTTVLGPNTLQISGDFAFYTIDALKTKFGSNVEVLFFNGAEGDISVGHKSNLSAVGVIAPFRTFEKARELGVRLADAVALGLPSLPYEETALQVRSAVVALPLKQYAPLAAMKAKREHLGELMREAEKVQNGGSPTDDVLVARQHSLFARIEEYYAILYEDERGPEPKSLPVELTCVTIGGTALISFPGEVFIALALEIREKSAAARTMFLGLANDYIGYIPTADANASAGYEVVAARVTPQAANILVEASLRVLQSTINTAAC